MKIVSLKLKNFRSYKDEVEIKFDDLTVFIGKNDTGKSTILEALDIFFNDGKGVVKIDKEDINVENRRLGNNTCEISVCFTDLPDRIIIDSAASTTLKDEYMLNSDGLLEIVKKYPSGGKTKVFIKANHPTNTECADLLSKKNSELKAIIRANHIECDNQSVNALMRKAIWDNFASGLQLEDIEIEAAKEDAKKLWEKLETYMPIYSLFQSDRKNSDGDTEVQDPLKAAIKEILSNQELEETLASVATVVQTKLQEVADRTLAKLKEMDPEVASSLHPVIPDVRSLKWQDVFKGVSISGDSDIPINKRGSGVKRLVLLNFFRGEAERRAREANTQSVIYAIEEPETSQHFDNQRMLVEAFKEMAGANNTQVIMTTHSAVVVKQLDFSNLRLIKHCDNCAAIETVLPGHLTYPSLNEVNYVAFGEVSAEYHDELYSHLEINSWLNEYASGKSTIVYNKQFRNGSTKKQQIILTEYIRHQIHHPENTSNRLYTREELQASIDMMRAFIQTKIDNNEMDEDGEE